MVYGNELLPRDADQKNRQRNGGSESGLNLGLEVILVNRLLDFRTTSHRRFFKSLTGTKLLYGAGLLKFLLVLFECLVDGFVFFNRNNDHGGLLNKGGKDRKESEKNQYGEHVEPMSCSF